LIFYVGVEVFVKHMHEYNFWGIVTVNIYLYCWYRYRA